MVENKKPVRYVRLKDIVDGRITLMGLSRKKVSKAMQISEASLSIKLNHPERLKFEEYLWLIDNLGIMKDEVLETIYN